MSESFFLLAKHFFNNLYMFLSSITIPGLDISAFTFLVSCFLISIVAILIKLLKTG